MLKRLRSASRSASASASGRGRTMPGPDSDLDLHGHSYGQSQLDYSGHHERFPPFSPFARSESLSRSKSYSRSRSRSRTGGHSRNRSRSLSASGLPVIASVAATEIESAKRANKQLIKHAVEVAAALCSLASKTRAFASALHAFADAAPALSDTPAHHVRQFAHLQSIAAHGYVSSAQHLSTDFVPSLRTNYACHKQTLKTNHTRFKLAQTQHNRNMKQVERSGAHLSDHIHPNRRHSADPRIATAQVSEYQSGIRDLSRLAMELEHIKNAHFDAVMDEEHRNAQFVAAACSTAMTRQSADLWVRTYAHCANSTPLTNGDGTLARPSHPPPPAPMPLANGGVMSTYYEAPPEKQKQHGLRRDDSGTYLLNQVDEENDLFQSAIYGQSNSRSRRAQSPRASAAGVPPRPPRSSSSPNHQVHRSRSLSSAPAGMGGNLATGYGGGPTRSSPPFVAPPPPAGSPPNHHHQQQQQQQRHYSPAGRSATLSGYPKSSSRGSRAPPAVSWSPAAAAAARAAASASPSSSAAGTYVAGGHRV